MNCGKITELLSPYIDGMTNEKETRWVESHLNSCADCRDELEQLKSVCNMVSNLPAPKLPEKFNQELKVRLANEKLKYFTKIQIKSPKRPGWIAASVAGIALAIGIFTSSLMPVSQLADNIYERFEKVQQHPSVAVDDILKRSGINMNNNNNISPQTNKNTNVAQDKNQAPVVDKTAANTEKTEDKSVATVAQTPLIALSGPQYTEEVTSRISVNDLGNSVQQVIKMAAANGGQYAMLSGNNTQLQALSVSRTKAVAITIDKANVDVLLNQLASVGKVAAPVYSNVELTKQYNEAINNINSIQQQINATDDQNRISELQNQLNQWNNKKSQFDNQLNQTTINVYLVEDEQP